MNPLNINFPWKRHSFYATWSLPFKILLTILDRKEAEARRRKHILPTNTHIIHTCTQTRTHSSCWETEIHCSTVSQFPHFPMKESSDLLCPTSNNMVRSPTLLAPKTGFMEDIFFHGPCWECWFGDDSGVLHLLCTLFPYSYSINSTSDDQTLDPQGLGNPWNNTLLRTEGKEPF